MQFLICIIQSFRNVLLLSFTVKYNISLENSVVFCRIRAISYPEPSLALGTRLAESCTVTYFNTSK